MKKLFSLIAIIMLMTSCASSKEFQVPMTEKMYQESKLEKKANKKKLTTIPGFLFLKKKKRIVPFQ